MASPEQPNPPAPEPTKPSTKKFVYHDTPCLNCGRYGCIPGRMISDSLNNIFCSPDCGWSFYLGPCQQDTTRAAAAAAMRTGAAPRARHKSRRSRSSKSSNSSKSATATATSTSTNTDPTLPRPTKSVSTRRPPKLPNAPLSAAERAAQACLDSSNAMFDFNAASDWWQ